MINKLDFMMVLRSTIILVLLILMAISCTSPKDKVIANSQEDVATKIDSLLALMTLEEKVAMCHAQSKFTTKGVPRLGIPELWYSDGPHGVRPEVLWDNWAPARWTNDSVTAFPALTCLAATFNPELSGEYGVAVGEEALYRGKDILLGPGVNIYRTPMNGRNFEYMGEDPHLASIMCVPYIHGVQQNGVAACIKHYALNNQEHQRFTINVEVGDRALREIYLPAYKAAVEEGKVWTAMGAYNKLHGQFASHNELLVKQILKGEWGFDGVLMSDWDATHDTEEAALNGLDVEMGTVVPSYNQYYLADAFLEKLKSGEIAESVVDEKVRRILKLMYRTSLSESRSTGRMNNEEHLDVALRVAEEGVVLLKNEENFFPIADNEGLTIAVIGQNATRQMTLGGGSSQLKAKVEISPLAGLSSQYEKAEVRYAMGYKEGADKVEKQQLLEEALALAEKADVVLLVGGLSKSHGQDCEGDDRTSFGLPFGQEELINGLVQVNPKLGVVLLSGNAVGMPWVDNVQGIIQSWYLGSMAGEAIANVVSGEVNPSGKLPFSFPAALSDNAAHSFGEEAYPGDGETVHFKEGILVGYRWHDTKGIKALFPFGHGLSYSDFTFSDFTADKKEYLQTDVIEVTGVISNNSQMAGSEVVQLYVGKVDSEVERALKELKAFQKVKVAPGEQKRVTLKVKVSDLAYYDTSISDWKVEQGVYKLYVGSSSVDITSEMDISVSN